MTYSAAEIWIIWILSFAVTFFASIASTAILSSANFEKWKWFLLSAALTTMIGCVGTFIFTAAHPMSFVDYLESPLRHVWAYEATEHRLGVFAKIACLSVISVPLWTFLKNRMCDT